MPLTLRRFLFSALLASLACGGSTSGCSGCGGFTTLPQGSFTGEKLDSAGAVRVSQKGFSILNANSAQLLELIAPGGTITSNVSCSISNVGVGISFAVGDTGTAGCTDESCGRSDGKCDAKDLGQDITVVVNSLTLGSKSPDVVEARINATVKTGVLPLSEPKSSLLCLFNGRAKCTVDLDSTRKTPLSNDLDLNLHLTIDPRWDKLLTVSITDADIGGAKACGAIGASPPPACIDPADIIIADDTGSCGACGTANLALLKTLLVDQLAKSLSKAVSKALTKATCVSCVAGDVCPSNAQATSTCDADKGQCIDSTTGTCVPKLLGVDGQLTVGSASTIALSIGAGGAVSAAPTGLTVGLRGGAKEYVVSKCVAPVTRGPLPALTLPDFDTESPGPYDVGFSLSGQFLSEALFRAEQSGALCIDLGHDSVSQLESSVLGAFLPSLTKVTQGANVPMRVVIRPINPPTLSIGAGTYDAAGKIIDPLLRLNWKALELDLYATLEERDARLFTLVADLNLPIGLQPDGCSGLTPVVGDLMAAITNIDVKNSETLAEPLDTLKALLPSLLTLAEPQLSKGLSKVAIPAVQGFDVQLAAAKGLTKQATTPDYTHLGVFANLVDAGTPCTPKMLRLAHLPAKLVNLEGAAAIIDTHTAQTFVSWRVDQGLWSTFQQTDVHGLITVSHPRLLLSAEHTVELRSADGQVETIIIDAPR